MVATESKKEWQRDLLDQVLHLEKLIERLITAMRSVRSPLETDRYADAIRDLVSAAKVSVLMEEFRDRPQCEINFLRRFLVEKISLYEDEWRRYSEGLANLALRREP